MIRFPYLSFSGNRSCSTVGESALTLLRHLIWCISAAPVGGIVACFCLPRTRHFNAICWSEKDVSWWKQMVISCIRSCMHDCPCPGVCFVNSDEGNHQTCFFTFKMRGRRDWLTVKESGLSNWREVSRLIYSTSELFCLLQSKIPLQWHIQSFVNSYLVNGLNWLVGIDKSLDTEWPEGVSLPMQKMPSDIKTDCDGV